MADQGSNINVAVVHAIEPGGDYTDTHGIIRLRLTQGEVPLAFTATQIAQLIPQLSGLLGKLKGDSGVVLRASSLHVGRTLDDSLRFDFSLLDGATLSVAIPMAHGTQAADHIRAEAEKASTPPHEQKRH